MIVMWRTTAVVFALIGTLVLSGCGGSDTGSPFGAFGGSGGAGGSGGGAAPGGGASTVQHSADASGGSGGGAAGSATGSAPTSSLRAGQCFVPQPGVRNAAPTASPCSEPEATWFVATKVPSGKFCPERGIRTNLILADDSELCLTVNWVLGQCYRVSPVDNVDLVHISCSTVRSAHGLMAINRHPGTNEAACAAPLDPWVDPTRNFVTCVHNYE